MSPFTSSFLFFASISDSARFSRTPPGLCFVRLHFYFCILAAKTCPAGCKDGAMPQILSGTSTAPVPYNILRDFTSPNIPSFNLPFSLLVLFCVPPVLPKSLTPSWLRVPRLVAFTLSRPMTAPAPYIHNHHVLVAPFQLVLALVLVLGSQ
ncbi:hypothetical protein FA15DRAFT_669446 [Coprinopsis marcescibilis]|uniref:Uncharacterized protein n=1 Tax=Coprinopsis marcescibilis TaxID=230819 RepID=A0A5C3KVK6_COPMA|nr:hypothetical protein FA15DRAFT_669446 [Coprinopsis marcescibilis]